MLISIFAMLLYLAGVLLITPMLLKVQSGEQAQRPNKTLFFFDRTCGCRFAFRQPVPVTGEYCART